MPGRIPPKQVVGFNRNPHAAAWELAFCTLGLIFGWLAISGKGLIVDKLFPPTQPSEPKDDVATSEGMRTMDAS
jgi:hypothetical protein